MQDMICTMSHAQPRSNRTGWRMVAAILDQESMIDAMLRASFAVGNSNSSSWLGWYMIPNRRNLTGDGSGLLSFSFRENNFLFLVFLFSFLFLVEIKME